MNLATPPTALPEQGQVASLYREKVQRATRGQNSGMLEPTWGVYAAYGCGWNAEAGETYTMGAAGATTSMRTERRNRFPIRGLSEERGERSDMVHKDSWCTHDFAKQRKTQ